MSSFRHENDSGKDRNLQLSQRLDWRFLLPNPHLGHVAYYGSADSELLKALTIFSKSLSIMSESQQTLYSNDSENAFDLVVFQSSNVKILQFAAELLKPGGLLYWEIDKRSLLSLKRGRHKKYIFNELKHFIDLWWRFNLYDNFTSHLERHGFRDIGFHWHRPNFKHCLEIISFSNSIALAYVFSRARGNFSSRLKLTAGRFLMTVGLLKYVAPCVSATASKEDSINP